VGLVWLKEKDMGIITALQIDEFGTVGRTQDGQTLRSASRPPFSFDYEVLTYTPIERSRFWKLERHKLTEEQEAEVERHIDSITVDTELTTQMAQNHQARKILADTDWYVVRKMETGKEIPADITDMRNKARSLVVNE
tara:strand:+ start:1158 stop:1571 length:414 start_codon:yes stop_codon:yes gene_type:complete